MPGKAIYINYLNDCGNNQQKLFHTLNRLVSKKNRKTHYLKGITNNYLKISVDTSMTK